MDSSSIIYYINFEIGFIDDFCKLKQLNLGKNAPKLGIFRTILNFSTPKIFLDL